MRFSADTLIQSLHSDLCTVIDVSTPSWSIDDSPQQVACYRLKESLLKKFNMAFKPSVEASSAAMEKFLAVNARVSNWELKLNTVQPDWELFSMLQLELKEFLDPSNLGPIYPDYSEMFDLGYAGPGASIGALGCDFYTKMFSSRLSCTEGLSDIWSMLVSRNEQLRLAFSDVTAVREHNVVSHNKLSFVNKNQDVARSICTEPSINMWMQLGLGRIISRRLKSVYNIDFSLQPEVNKRLARIGSISDQLVTIDLESASDSLGLRMMDRTFPCGFMKTLRRLRSPNCSLPNGSFVELGMVSTMGNGFTFPLQTLLFAACCVVVMRYLDIPLKSRGIVEERNFGVFGDDIIVPTKVAPLLLHLLKMLGFLVNDSKTYVEGPFRESCGGDYFLGSDVRPVYLKSLRSLQDSFVAVNKLNQWTAKTGVPLRNTVAYVLQLFGARKYPVPLDEADDAGLQTPVRFLSDQLKRAVPRGFGLLRYTSSVPRFFGYRVDDISEKLIGHPRNVAYNPNGLLVSFLGGYISGSRVALRQTPTRYLTKRRVTPRWEYLRPDILSEFPDRVARLNNAFGLNVVN